MRLNAGKLITLLPKKCGDEGIDFQTYLMANSHFKQCKAEKIVATERMAKLELRCCLHCLLIFRIMWRALEVLSTTLIHYPEYFTQPRRSVFILKRKNNVRLNKLGAVGSKKLKKRSFYYELLEDTDNKKKPPVEIVLAKDVAGIGMKGEKIEMNIYIAYRDLLLPKLAVYANSPEAQSLMTVKEEKCYSSIYSKIVENYLASQAVEIILSNDTPWTLEPWHVKLALRKNGIFTNEDCISIPKKISGPKFEIENKDFIVYVTMNESETFSIRCRIYHWSSSEPYLNQKSFDLYSVSEPLFPDEKEKINSLIKVEEEIRKNQMLKKLLKTDKSKKKK